MRAGRVHAGHLPGRSGLDGAPVCLWPEQRTTPDEPRLPLEDAGLPIGPGDGDGGATDAGNAADAAPSDAGGPAGDGCGCRTTGGAPHGGLALLGLLAVGLARPRRRAPRR